jgi:hypothetical protein
MNPIPLLLLTALLAWGCRKDSTPEPLTLLFPVLQHDMDPCCIDFQWRTPHPEASHLTVSASPGFEDPVLDTVLSAPHFSYASNLEPDRDYYWRVRQGAAEKTSSFRVRDILTNFAGTCMVEVHKTFWGAAQGTDTLYTDTIRIIRNGREVDIDFPGGGFYRSFRFHNYTSAPGRVFYLYPAGSQTCTLFLDYRQDSVFVQFRSGGLGGGIIWDMKGKK